MKTEQEQIERMAQVMCGFCTENKRCVLKYSAPCSEVASQDCTCKESAEELICKGYGKVSEYKAEIERLKAKLTKAEHDRDRYKAVIDDLKNENVAICEQIKRAYGTGYNGGYKSCQEEKKQAQIDVLNKLRRIAWQGYQIGMYIVSTQEIDALIKEVQNAEDKG